MINPTPAAASRVRNFPIMPSRDSLRRLISARHESLQRRSRGLFQLRDQSQLHLPLGFLRSCPSSRSPHRPAGAFRRWASARRCAAARPAPRKAALLQALQLLLGTAPADDHAGRDPCRYPPRESAPLPQTPFPGRPAGRAPRTTSRRRRRMRGWRIWFRRARFSASAKRSRPSLRAVHCAARAENFRRRIRAPLRRRPPGPARAFRGRAHRRRAPAIAVAQHRGHGGFARSDPAGEADAQHQGCDDAAAGARAPRRMRAAFTVLLISMAMVSGPTPPGTGVYAPATSTTSGMNVAHKNRALSRETIRASRETSRRCAPLRPRSVTTICPTSITVAPGRTKSGVTIAARADRGDDDVRAARDSRQVACSSNGRSSPSRWRAAAAAPSACRRCRCGRSPRRSRLRSECCCGAEFPSRPRACRPPAPAAPRRDAPR